MTRQEAVDYLTRQNGKIVAVEFRKRGDGNLRLMTCRQGVVSRLKGGEPSYDATSKGLIRVFDMNAMTKDGKQGDYRCVPVEGITQIKVDGQWVSVQ